MLKFDSAIVSEKISDFDTVFEFVDDCLFRPFKSDDTGVSGGILERICHRQKLLSIECINLSVRVGNRWDRRQTMYPKFSIMSGHSPFGGHLSKGLESNRAL